jgi:hypothetical protein
MTTTDETAENASAERWQRFVTREIRDEGKRLRGLRGVTVEILHTELCGTVIDLIQDLGRMVLEVSGSTGQWLGSLTDHLEQVDDRVGAVESLLSGNDVTQITPEHADKLMALATGTKELMRFLVETASGLTEEAKAKLTQHAALAEECEAIVSACVLEPDEDEEDGEEEKNVAPAPAAERPK